MNLYFSLNPPRGTTMISLSETSSSEKSSSEKSSLFGNISSSAQLKTLILKTVRSKMIYIIRLHLFQQKFGYGFL